jgi:hypothetical protein
LTSTVPDKYLQELKSFAYDDPRDGSTKMVQVNSVSRVPQFGAMCGSVVVMQTSLGEFTLDHEHMYHGDLNTWVDVAGQFDLDDRRRLAQTEHGRRRLGADESAAGMFNYIESEGGELQCERMWMNETSSVKPSAPKIPYSYVAYSIVSCWQPDEMANHLDHTIIGDKQGRVGDSINVTESDQGSTRQCISTYGPNAGKHKAGVSADGTSMVSVQYALVTESMTYTILREWSICSRCSLKFTTAITDLILYPPQGTPVTPFKCW